MINMNLDLLAVGGGQKQNRSGKICGSMIQLNKLQMVLGRKKSMTTFERQ